MDTSTSKTEFLFEKFVLAWYEYIVFGIIMAASLGIGIFFGKKKTSNEEYLMAGRSMSVLPVSLSLVISFVSAITLLGNPAEVYFYGMQYALIAFSYIPMTAVLAYIYVPVYFELQLTSAYEYFEWRFSKELRVVMSVFAMIHLIVYMPITVWGPSLALEEVAGINAYLSAITIFLVCIVYSSIGGLKAVLWTDSLQVVVVIVSLASVFGIGVYKVGGLSYIWEVSAASGRTELFNFDPDLRTRHTFWTSTVGGTLLWLPLFAATQAQIQRYNSVPTLRDSRKCLVFNMIGLMIINFLCSIIGLMIYAHYATCDPVRSERVTSADQLLPLFVIDVLRDYSGIPGLLVAGITCASLSTISTSLNALTVILVEDYVKIFRPGMDDDQLVYISQIVSTMSGLIAFALVFIVAVINRSIQISPFSTLMHGSLIGPILGAFTLGMFFPWTNNLGTLLGVGSSFVVSGFVGLGHIFAGGADKLPHQTLDLTTIGCKSNSSNSTENSLFLDYPRDGYDLSQLISINYTHPKSDWKNEDYSFEVQIWSISYIWQPCIGVVCTLVFGMIFSAIVIVIRWKSTPVKVNKCLLSKPFLRLWKFCFGQGHLDKWVDYDSPAYGLRDIQKRASAAGISLSGSENSSSTVGIDNGNGCNDADSDVPNITDG